jgi:hypothetical protein
MRTAKPITRRGETLTFSPKDELNQTDQHYVIEGFNYRDWSVDRFRRYVFGKLWCPLRRR